MENRISKNENIKRNTEMLLLELEKDFIDLKDRELKDREIKLKREIEELFFKLIFFPIEDIDWFKERNEENNAN